MVSLLKNYKQKGFITFGLLRFGLHKRSLHEGGFTLIELLIVITIIATLAVTVFVALNPAQRLKDAKDARRTSDVDTILTAIHAYIVDNKGNYPTGLSAGMVEKQLGTSTGVPTCVISTGGCSVAAAADCVNLTTPLNKYLKSMPVSPDSGSITYSPATTGYSVIVDANGIVTIRACGTEGAIPIAASR